MRDKLKAGTLKITVISAAVIVLLLVLSTVWSGISARRSTESAVHTVSNFYLGELAGRREQVVASNLFSNIQNMNNALELLEGNDLSDAEHLQAFQAGMKKLYSAEKFAFVDTNGVIYTSLGPLYNIDDYSFDYLTISGPEVSINDISSEDKKVVIAVPVNHLPFDPLLNEDQRAQLQRDDAGMQFSHSLEEQINGQLEAGFTLTALYEDTNGEGRLHELNIPTFLAMRSVKM